MFFKVSGLAQPCCPSHHTPATTLQPQLQPPHSSHHTPATAPVTTLQPTHSSHNTPATTLQTKLQPQLQPRRSSHHTPATILQPRHSSHNSPATALQTQNSSHNTQHVWGSPAWIIDHSICIAVYYASIHPYIYIYIFPLSNCTKNNNPTFR